MIFYFTIGKDHFIFLTEFNCTFSISYKIILYYVYYYCILIR